jgi:hypothetical protein
MLGQPWTDKKGLLMTTPLIHKESSTQPGFYLIFGPKTGFPKRPSKTLYGRWKAISGSNTMARRKTFNIIDAVAPFD